MGTSHFNSNYNCHLFLETTSTIDVEEVTCEWKLNVGRRSWVDDSPVFGGSGKGLAGQHSWKLRWKRSERVKYLKDEKEETYYTYYVEVYLVSAGDPRRTAAGVKGQAKAKAFVSFKNINEEIQEEVEFRAVTAGNMLTNLKSIDEKDLFDPENHHLDGNMLTIYCRILVATDLNPTFEIVNHESDTESEFEITASPRKTSIRSMMKSALSSAEFADIHLVTATKTFSAHKAILAAQSPVFAALFRSKLEIKNNSVDIQDFDEITVEAMLDYMYTGQTLKIPAYALDLLRISDKYELLELKEECEEFLCTNFEIKSAVETFHLATLLNAKTLEYSVKQFILRNKKEVSETDAFKKYAESHPSIIIKLLLSD